MEPATDVLQRKVCGLAPGQHPGATLLGPHTLLWVY